MTPPGPHAMTAQAGAVACDVVWPDGGVVATRVDIDYADELLSEYKWRDCKKVNFVYTAPPAAVPVEALEGLVDALRNEAATIAKPYGFVTEHIIGKAEGLESCAERIERLIKERSK